MKFCSNCGNSIEENAIFCSHCGARVNGDAPFMGGGFNPYGSYSPYNSYPIYDNRPSRLMAVLGFIFIDIGFIIWLFTRRTRPGSARSALNGMLSRLSFSLPVVGLVAWLLWKDDSTKHDIAKIMGISAIVGTVLYLILGAALLVLGVTDNITQSITELPFSNMMAYVLHTLR